MPCGFLALLAGAGVPQQPEMLQWSVTLCKWAQPGAPVRTQERTPREKLQETSRYCLLIQEWAALVVLRGRLTTRKSVEVGRELGSKHSRRGLNAVRRGIQRGAAGHTECVRAAWTAY